MSSQLEQLQFNFARRVPEGAIPLAYVNVPTPDIGQHLKLVGTGKYTVDNVDGLVVKNVAPSISISQKNITNSLAVSGIIIANKVADPSFLYGFVPSASASWNTINGTWNWDLTNGRTSLNSVYDTGDEPAVEQGPTAAPMCAAVDWNTGAAYVQIITDSIQARVAGQEALYDASNVAYQLSLWIATDPVDSYGKRRGSASWQEQDVSQTRIDISIVGCDAGGTAISTMWVGHIGWPYYETRSYLTQRTKTFLRFRSPYLRITDPTIVNFKVKIEGTACQGVYFDDVRLRSYTYALGRIADIGGGAAWVYGDRTGGRPHESVPGFNTLLNPELIDNEFVNGDFNNAFRNLLTDPSFENGKWTTYSGATIKWGADNLGRPRTGNAYLENDNPGEGAYIDVTGLDNTKAYRFGGWNRSEDLVGYQSGDGRKRCVLKVELYDSGPSLLATLQSPVVSGGDFYQEVTWAWSSSGYPTTVSWRFKVESVSPHVGTGQGQIWDDMELLEAVDPIPNWTFYPSQAVNPSGGVLAYNEVNNQFAFGTYHKPSTADNLHYIYSWRTIYKNNLYQFTRDFCDRYFNTEHKMVSDAVAVTQGEVYGINYTLQWIGARANITLDMDPTIRGAFAEPFRITYLDPRGSGFSILDITNYGSIIAVVEGLDPGGNVVEVPLEYSIGPAQGNLPTESFFDSRTGWNYTQISPPKFTFAHPLTSQARVTFKFRSTIAGVNTITLNQYTIAGTGDAGGAFTAVKVYSFSNKISVDRIYVDETEAWRLGIKDGIFERRFTMSSSEPSGSWLRSVGFSNGDDLVLIYTVPEYNLDVQWLSPDQPNFIRHLQEAYRQRCEIADDRTLWLGNSDIIYINEILINGTTIVTGATSGTTSIQAIVDQYPDLIESIDPIQGTIKFKRGLNDRDLMEASYFYKESRYTYTGYYDGQVWHDLDLNPSAGHRWHFGEDNRGQAGFDIVNNPVVVYLLPTAAYYASGDVTGNYIFHTAFELDPELRPTCFVRHLSGIQVNEGEVPGYPSATIIGKIFIVPPGSINDVNILDIRSRGGGLPEDWPSDTNYRPVDFIEESRFRIPVGDPNWLNTHVQFYNNDYVTIQGFGFASGSPSGDPFTIVPSNSLWGSIAMTTPSTGASGDFQVSFGWNRTIGYTMDSSGNWFLSATQASTGILFLKVINNDAGQTGELFATVRIRRKLFEGSNWDIGSWDGEPVMINGVVVFEIPSDILTGSNGYRQMTAQQVEEAVQKHVAAGVHYIIRYV